jgi:hypothetical protein
MSIGRDVWTGLELFMQEEVRDESVEEMTRTSEGERGREEEGGSEVKMEEKEERESLHSFDKEEEKEEEIQEKAKLDALVQQEKNERTRYLKQQLRKKLPQVIRERMLVIDKNAQYATLCILDAFQGRMSNGLATNSKKSKLMFTIFCIQTSDWFLNLIIFSSILHTFMIFLEPNSQDCSPEFSFFLTLTHSIIFFIHFMDVALKMAYQGFWEYLDHDWQFLYCITISLHFFDLLYFHRTTFTNPLRPVVGLLRDRSFRRFFSVVKLMIPCLSETLAPLLAFLVIISVITNVSFSSFFEEMNQDITDASLRQIHYNWLWLVLTNDTFLRLFPETAEGNVLYVIFFFTVLYIGQRFILSVILGATFETFTKFTSEQVKKEQLKVYQGLTKAFSVLDDRKTGYISDLVFTSLMRNLEPSYQPEEITLYYELISNGNPKGVSVLQFLNLSDVLSFKFERKGKVSIHESKLLVYNLLEKYQERVVIPFCSFQPSESFQRFLNRTIELLDQKKLLMYSNWLDIFFLSFGLLDYQLLQISPAAYPLLIVTPGLLMRMLNIFEFTCRIILKKGQLLSLLIEIRDIYTLIFLVGAVGIILIDSNLFLYFLWSSHTTAAATAAFNDNPVALLQATIFLKILRVLFRCFRIIRVFRTNEELSSFVEGIVSVAPIFFQNMGFAFIVNYIFAMLGQLFFHHYVLCFSTPAEAMITLLKLFLPFNFLDVLEEVMEKVHPIVIIYFLSFFLMSLIISNLSLTIIIEWYSDSLKEKKSKAKDGKGSSSKSEQQYEHLFHTIVSRARLRRVFSSRSDVELLYSNLRMIKSSSSFSGSSSSSSSDHRLIFVEKDGLTITKNDLKKCQKHSNINLLEFYEAQSKELKKLTWEADFVQDLLEAKVGKVKKFHVGEVLCHQETPALEGFILIAGVVEIRLSEKDEKKKDIVIKALQLLGGTCLSPHGIHPHTCVAASDDVECLVISKDAVMSDQIDQHIIGQLLRLYYKTNDDIEKISIEYAQKPPMRLSSLSSVK